MSTLSKSLLILFCFLVVSCQDENNNKNVNTFKVDQNLEVLQKIENAIRDKNQKIAFSSYSRQDNLRLDSALETAKGGLLSLAGEADLYGSYLRIGASLESFKTLKVLEIDQQRLDDIFNKLKSIYNALSSKLGKTEEQQEWTLYNYAFSAGLEPEFSAYASKQKWGTNLLTDVSKAQVSGDNGSNSWMVSRSFLLSEIKNPSFRFKTVLMVDSKDPNLDRKEAIENYFKVYVILNPSPFENLAKLSDEEIKSSNRIIEMKYSADDMPLGERFHKKWTPPKDLSKYKESELAIAFRFAPPAGGARQYHMWQILDFEINGAGALLNNPVKQKKIFEGEALPQGFHVVTKAVEGKNWRAVSEGKGFISVAGGSETQTWLLTPKYYLTKGLKAASLNLLHEFNKNAFEDNCFSKMEVLISKNFVGGDPEQANWDKLEYSKNLEEKSSSYWTTVFSKDLDLAEYIGGEVVFAFRYSSETTDSHEWRLKGFSLNGQGAKRILAFNYNLGCFSSDPFEKDIFYSFDLDSQMNKETKDISVSGVPAKWRTAERDEGPCLPSAYYEISGHSRNGNHKFGETRKVFPSVNLTDLKSASFRILHSLRFWNDLETTKVQISIKGSDAWEDLVFPEGVFADKLKNLKSSWVKIPSKYFGNEVLFSLKYKSFKKDGKNYTPNWSFKKIEVKEDKL